MIHVISPRSGTAFRMARGQTLRVIDPEGEQVADLVAYNAHDSDEVISSGRTLDYASRIYLTTGDPLYSNRSQVMLRITEDMVGRHDFLLTPCSADTFRIIYNDTAPHRGCFGNLAEALAPFGIAPDRIPVAFNVFMNVAVDARSGALRVDPAAQPGRRSCRIRGRAGPNHRAYGLFGAAIEQLRVQADPLRGDLTTEKEFDRRRLAAGLHFIGRIGPASQPAQAFTRGGIIRIVGHLLAGARGGLALQNDLERRKTDIVGRQETWHGGPWSA